MPPGFGQRIEDRDVVSEQRQVERGGQSGGPAPAMAILRPVGSSLRAAMRLRGRLRSVSDSRIVSAMKRCTSRMLTGFVDGLPAAALVARMLAHAPGGAGQRIVQDHGLEGVLQPALLVELQEARNVHVQRTTVLAGRQRQFLADARLAALRDDVVFELLAEVPHGGEHRVGRGLAQAAQRAVADVAAQLVQGFQVLPCGPPQR